MEKGCPAAASRAAQELGEKMGIWGAQCGWRSTAEKWPLLGLRASSWQL